MTDSGGADEVAFLESLSSLSMDSTTRPSGALSPTSLLSENSRSLHPQRGAGLTYLNTASANMVVNDMDTSLTQLQAEETKYYMSVHA